RARAPPAPPLFPYTALFRSRGVGREGGARAGGAAPARARARSALPLPPRAWTEGGAALRAAAPVRAGARFLLVGALVSACASTRSEEHTSELQSLTNLVCRL